MILDKANMLSYMQVPSLLTLLFDFSRVKLSLFLVNAVCLDTKYYQLIEENFFSSGNIGCVIFYQQLFFYVNTLFFFIMYRNKVFESYFWCYILVLHFLAKVDELPSRRF